MRSVRCALLLVVVVAFGPSMPSPARAAEKQPAETASQFYMRWRDAALKAKSVDEIVAFWTAETKEEFNMEPDAAKAETLPMIKRYYATQTEVKVVNETATSRGATLSLEALDADKQPVVCSIQVVKENGAWKITNAVERWKPKD